MTLPYIPILRRGQPYDSLDRVEISDIRTGEPVALLSQANAGLIRRDLRRISPGALQETPVEHLLALCEKAGKLFMEALLPLSDGLTQSPAQYIELLSATSGLPHTLVRKNMAKIHQVFTQMPTILCGLTRGLDGRILDTGIGEQAGVLVSFYAVTNALGVVLPSNSPGVNTLWMPAVVLKIPVILKPGREEPWTPFRILQAFIAAGYPPEAFSFYPTDHEGSAVVLESCGRTLVFGDASTVERYAGNPSIQVHGPGHSKVLIGEDLIDHWPDFLSVIVDSIIENGGRSCINASAIVVPKHANEIAEAVAEQLAAIEPRPLEDETALLAGFPNPKLAEFIDAAINDGLAVAGAEDVTAKYRSGLRRVTQGGITYLLPTLIRCHTFEHPLSNREFLFPYASIVEVPQEKMLDVIGPSLVVTAITQDQSFIGRLIASPLIDRLNIGPLPTTRVQWDQPHEGNLFEFLYRRRAIQRI
jgi:acyl-CoA reductase-like NAD-dependent aldehyde dehydrogenase